jgi:hypothetical protein
MAEREMIFNLKLNTGNTAQDIDNINKELNDLEKQLDSTGEAAEGTSKDIYNLGANFEDIYGDLKPLSGRLGELEDRMYELALAGKTNTDEFKALQAETVKYRRTIIDVDAQVDALAERGAKLNAALQLGEGVLAGYQAFTGVTAMLGVEDEKLLETLTKLQAVQGALNGLRAIEQTFNRQSAVFIQGQAVATAALTAAKAAYATVVGTATGALKLFRIALAATGIGAIIVGIGLLITNFEKLVGWVQQGYQSFNKLGTGIKVVLSIMFPVVGIIWGIVEALKAMGIVEDETAAAAQESARKQRQAQQDIIRAKRKAVDEALAENQRLIKSIGSTYDWEIAKAQAAGKNTAQLEQMKRDEMRKTLEAQIELLEQSIQLNATNAAAMVSAMRQVAAARAEIVKIDQETELSAIRIQTERTNKAKEESNKRVEIAREEAKRMSELRAEMINTIEQLENEYLNSQLTKQQQELNAVHEKYFAIIEAARAAGESTLLLEEARQSALNEINTRYELERQAKLDELQAQYLMTQEERDIMAAEMEHMKRLAEIEAIVQDENLKQMMIEAAQEQHNQKLGEINDQYRKEELEKEKQLQDDKRQLAQDYLSAASNFLGALSTLNDAVTQSQLNNAKGNAAKEEEIRKKSFERNKKLQIAMAVINMAQGILSAMASPFPMNIAMAVIAAATGAANIAKIASTKYESASASGAAATPATPNMSSASAATAGFSSTDSTTTQLNEDGTVAGGGAPQPQQTVQVAVLESDISMTQQNMQQVEVRSTF